MALSLLDVEANPSRSVPVERPACLIGIQACRLLPGHDPIARTPLARYSGYLLI